MRPLKCVFGTPLGTIFPGQGGRQGGACKRPHCASGAPGAADEHPDIVEVSCDAISDDECIKGINCPSDDEDFPEQCADQDGELAAAQEEAADVMQSYEDEAQIGLCSTPQHQPRMVHMRLLQPQVVRCNSMHVFACKYCKSINKYIMHVCPCSADLEGDPSCCWHRTCIVHAYMCKFMR